MLGASCGLEISEIVLTEWRTLQETADVIASGSSKDISNSGFSIGSVQMESKPCSKSATTWSRMKLSYTLVPGESRLVMTPYL